MCSRDEDALTTFSSQHAVGLGVHPHMKVGLGAGTLTRALVGQRNQWVLHVLAGVALERAVAAQRQCRRGEVVADAGLVAALPSTGHTAMRGEWFVLRADSAVEGAASAASRRSRPAPATCGDGLQAAPSPQAHHLVDEHRLVTTVFLALPDMEVPRDGGAKLQDYLSTVMPVLRGGTAATCARSTPATRDTSW